MVAGYAGLGTAPAGALPARRADARRRRRRRRLDRRGRRRATPDRRRRDGRDRPGRPDHADRRAGRSPAPTTSATPWPPSRSGSCSASRPTPSGAAAAAFTGVEHRLEPVADIDGVRFVNDSQGTQPDAVIAALRAFEAPIVLIAGGRDKDVDLPAWPPVVAERAAAAVLIGESGPDLEALFRERRPRRGSSAPTTLDDAVGRPTPSPARPSPRPAATRTGDGAAQPGRGQLRHVRRLRGARARLQGGRRGAARARTQGEPDEPVAAHPSRRSRRDRRPRRDPAGAPSNRTPVTSRSGAVRRERHEPDYVILLVVVALAALGILMVYSSSALKGYLADDDTFATVGPQILGRCSASSRCSSMMRIDYRYLRLVSVPLYIVALVSARRCVLVARPQHRGRRLGALAEDRAAAGGAPGRVRQARAGHLPRPLVRAARAPRSGGFWSRHGPVPGDRRADPAPRPHASPTSGTTGVLALTALTMFFVAGGNLLQLGALAHGGHRGARSCSWPRPYQLDRVQALLDPWADPPRRRLPHRPGPAGAGHRRPLRHRARREPRSFVLPHAHNDFVFADVRPGVRLHRRRRS